MNTLNARYAIIDIHLIEVWDLNPEDRTKHNRALGNLMDAIKKTKFIYPILVVYSENELNKKYVAIEGNRRLEACRILNIEKVPVFLIEKKQLNTDLVSFFGHMNEAKRLTGKNRDNLFLTTRNTDVLTKAQNISLNKLLWISNALTLSKYAVVDGIIKCKKSFHSVKGCTETVLNYCKKSTIQAQNWKIVIDWILFNNEQTPRLVNICYTKTMPGRTIWQHIMDNRPITGKQ